MSRSSHDLNTTRRGQLRRRLFGVHGPCAMDVWLLWLGSIAALMSSVLILAAVSLQGTLTPWIAVSLGLPWVARVVSRFGREGQAVDIGLRAVALGLIPLAGVEAGLFFPLLLTVLALLLLRHAESDDLMITSFVLSGVAAGGVAASIGGPLAPLIALPGICFAATGVLWVQARLTRRRVRRTTRDQPEESASGLRGRALMGCAVGALLLILVPASFETANRVERAYTSWMGGDLGDGEFGAVGNREEGGSGKDGRSRGGSRSRADPLERPSSTDPAESETEEDRPPRIVRQFPDQLNFLGATSLVQGEQSKRLELRVLAPNNERRRFGPARPAYLMTTTYEGFGPEGLLPSRYDAQRDYQDSGDGARDGWTQVVTDPLRGVRLDLQLAISALRAPGTSARRLTMPRIEPLIAAKRSELRHRASGMVSVPDDGEQIQEFTFRTRLPYADPLQLRRPVFDRSDRRFLRIPTQLSWQPVVQGVRAQLEELDSNEETLRAVLAHFKRRYRYSLATPDPGLEGLATFLEMREGYCTYFATSAMLMLRLLDVPARVAAGYRVTRWNEDRGAYVAGDQSAHAWVEVRLVGEGWVPIDPTPAVSLAQAIAMREQQLLRSEAAERAARALAKEDELDASESVPGLIASEDEIGVDEAGNFGDEPGDGGAAGSTQVGDPSSGGPDLRTLPLIFAVALFVFILMRGLMTSGRPAGEGSRPPTDGGGPTSLPELYREDDDYWRVVRLLARLGFRPGGLRTPLEFAHGFVARYGARFGILEPIARMMYGRRYGERPMTGEPWKRFLHFESAVDRAVEEDNWDFYLADDGDEEVELER